MGTQRKADISETQFGNSASWLASGFLFYPPVTIYILPRIFRYLQAQSYKPALALIDTLLAELRRLDDKLILTEVYLLESRVYRGIGNWAKAKVSSLDS